MEIRPVLRARLRRLLPHTFAARLTIAFSGVVALTLLLVFVGVSRDGHSRHIPHPGDHQPISRREQIEGDPEELARLRLVTQDDGNPSWARRRGRIRHAWARQGGSP